MNRRSLLALGLAVPWLHGCQNDRFVEISWTEEVALHDGSVIVAALRFIYERIGGRFHTDRFAGLILRDTELSFDAGAPSGRVTQLFKRQRPMVLERDSAGGWVLVLEGRASFAPGTTQPDWGPDQNGNGQRMARLQQGTFVLAHLRDLPLWVGGANFLMDYAPVEELARFDKQSLSLSDKQTYLAKYTLGSSDRHIARPQT